MSSAPVRVSFVPGVRQVAAALEAAPGDQADEAPDRAHPLLLGLAARLPIGHAGDGRPGGRNAAIGNRYLAMATRARARSGGGQGGRMSRAFLVAAIAVAAAVMVAIVLSTTGAPATENASSTVDRP
jgi:hypothetical protein